MPIKTDRISHIKPPAESLQQEQSSNELILFYMNYPHLCSRKGRGFTGAGDPCLGSVPGRMNAKGPVQNDAR